MWPRWAGSTSVGEAWWCFVDVSNVCKSHEPSERYSPVSSSLVYVTLAWRAVTVVQTLTSTWACMFTSTHNIVTRCWALLVVCTLPYVELRLTKCYRNPGIYTEDKGVALRNCVWSQITQNMYHYIMNRYNRTILRYGSRYVSSACCYL